MSSIKMREIKKGEKPKCQIFFVGATDAISEKINKFLLSEPPKEIIAIIMSTAAYGAPRYPPPDSSSGKIPPVSDKETEYREFIGTHIMIVYVEKD